jgi:nocturnin
VDHYEDHFRPALAGLGYEGLFKPKNGEGDADGCALFFKTARFELVAHKGIDFEGHTQVALIVRLRLRDSLGLAVEGQAGRDVCVAVTHLKAKEGFEEKRLEEGILLLRSALGFVGGGGDCSEEENAKHIAQAPLIVLGDFNDVPSSLVCRYFRSELPLPEVHASVPPHPFRLRSAYAHHPPLGEGESNDGEPYSTYKKREVEIVRTIDYIWYPVDAMVPVALLAVPSLSQLPDRLPCRNHPSDHLALYAELAWRE